MPQRVVHGPLPCFWLPRLSIIMEGLLLGGLQTSTNPCSIRYRNLSCVLPSFCACVPSRLLSGTQPLLLVACYPVESFWRILHHGTRNLDITLAAVYRLGPPQVGPSAHHHSQSALERKESFSSVPTTRHDFYRLLGSQDSGLGQSWLINSRLPIPALIDAALTPIEALAYWDNSPTVHQTIDRAGHT